MDTSAAAIQLATFVAAAKSLFRVDATFVALPMEVKMLATICLSVGLGILGLYELYALYNRDPGDTISELVWKAAVKRPLLPFAFGLLMGHWFWSAVCK